MGHAVYSLSDPRANILRSFVEKLSREKGRNEEYELYSLVERLGPEIISELCRYSPSEVLFNAAILDYKEVTAYIKQQLACSVELLDEAAFAPDACMEEMRAQFGDAPEKRPALRRKVRRSRPWPCCWDT